MIKIEGAKGFNISYKYCGLFITQDEWIHSKRQIDTYEIIYVVDGEVFIQEEEAQYRLVKGDILILYPWKTHFGYRSSFGNTSFYWVHFTISDFTSLELEPQHLSYSDNYKFTSMFKQLIHIANTSYYPAYSPELILLLILNEMSIVLKENQNKASKLIKDISEWVRINCTKKITVDDIAREFKYNADYLSALYKKTFGMGLKQYINKEKMKYAKNLLLTSTFSIKQISNILGYDDENQFIHYFKYHESFSPAKYRNMYYNTHFNNK